MLNFIEISDSRYTLNRILVEISDFLRQSKIIDVTVSKKGRGARHQRLADCEYFEQLPYFADYFHDLSPLPKLGRGELAVVETVLAPSFWSHKTHEHTYVPYTLVLVWEDNNNNTASSSCQRTFLPTGGTYTIPYLDTTTIPY